VKLYADRPGRAARQLIADVAAVAWTVLWVWLAFRVHEQVLRLAAPGRALEDAGNRLERNLSEAGRTAEKVPVVGDELRGPFDAAAGGGRSLADAGRSQQELVGDIALTLALLTALLPLILVLGWAVRRWRWVQEASAATAMLRTSGDASLFALRALATQPLPRLRQVAPDPFAGWRAGDPAVVAALAQLEVSGLGLRLPADRGAISPTPPAGPPMVHPPAADH